MLIRHRPLALLSLLSSLLTLGASGDDFCLARLALPALFAAADVLPLDDPNTDGLLPTASPAPRHPEGWGDPCRAGSCPPLACLSPAPPGPLPGVAPTPTSPFLSHAPPPPLRC
jgi:hypothetical protein